MRIDSSSQIIKHKRIQRPKSYFQLVEKVGAEGKYQLRILVIFLLVWFLIGASFVNVKFLFQGSDFQCQENGLLTGDCEQTVCQLPFEEREKYLNKDKNQLKSMIIEISEYYCEDKPYITFSKLSFSLGAFLGLLGFSYFSDNFGRRKSILFSLGFCCLGNIVLSMSPNLLTASIGLLLSGIGSSSTLITTVFFFNESASNKKRQKYTVSVELSFSLGTILITCFYYIIPQWRIISIIFMTVPSFISLFLVFLYVEETPQFLLRMSNDQGLKSINRIGNLNYKVKEILEQEDILAVKQSQVVLKQFDEMKVNVSNIMKFGSLKLKFLDCCLISFATFFIYEGSQSVIGSFGFDIYSKHFVMQLSELTVLVPIWIYVQKLRRKFVGVSVFMIGAILSGVLMFLAVSSKCGNQCMENTLQIIMVVIVRIAAAFNTCILMLYMNELFPIKVSGLGVGTPMAFGQLGILVIQCAFVVMDSNLLFFMFCGLSFIACCVTNFLTQTKGQSIKIDIQEVQILKNRQKSLLSGRNTFIRHSMVQSHFKPEQNNSSLII